MMNKFWMISLTLGLTGCTTNDAGLLQPSGSDALPTSVCGDCENKPLIYQNGHWLTEVR